jgi:hypothetical protein
MRSLVVAAALMPTAAGSLHAQHPQTREGFWISFGLGYGSAGISCDGCGAFDREAGFTSYVRLGGTISPRLLLGGDISAWTKTRNGQTSTLGGMFATLVLYPAPARGFFVRGGAGFSLYAESNGSNVSGAGAGLLAGAGYDIRAGRNVSLTAFVDFLVGSVGDLTTDAGTTVETGFSQNVIHAGLGVTFH